MNLKEVAKEVALLYQENNKVQAVLLAGSVSRNWQDQFSDIELHILWSEPPTDRERMNPIEQLEGKILDFFPYEDEEWSESFLLPDNIKLEISNFLVNTVEKLIDDVVYQFETDLDKQCMIASIHFGFPLYGEKLLNDLKKKVELYPRQLAENMVLENLDFGTRWNNRNALLARGDWLMLMDVICSINRKLLGVLFGLNELYIHHPAFKWMHQSIEIFTIKPPGLEERLKKALLGDINEAIVELESLIEDVQNLVQQKFTHLNIEPFRQKATFVRPENIH